MSKGEMEAWKDMADEAIEKVFPLLQEAREAHLVHQDRVKRVREQHSLDELDHLDELTLELLPSSYDVNDRLAIRKHLEILRHGQERFRKEKKDGDSTNAPSLRVFEGESGECKSAFCKESLKEAALALSNTDGDPGDERTGAFQRVFDKDAGVFKWEPAKLEEMIPEQAIPAFKRRVAAVTSEAFREQVKEYLAKKIGVTPKEVVYDNQVFNARAGVAPGESVIREVVQSRFDMLLGFGVVPLTVARIEVDGHDIASVQADVRADDMAGIKGRQLDDEEANQLFENSPETWFQIFNKEKGAEDGEPKKSLARAGALAFLMGDLDGIERNIMLDPETGRVWKIDNGLSLGLVTNKFFDVDVAPERGGNKNGKLTCAEMVKSVPLEIMMKHRLILDPEAHKMVVALHNELKDRKSKKRECIEGLFHLVFKKQGEHMVKYQMEEFLKRLRVLAVHGYPANLRKNIDYYAIIEEGLKQGAAKQAA